MSYKLFLNQTIKISLFFSQFYVKKLGNSVSNNDNWLFLKFACYYLSTKIVLFIHTYYDYDVGNSIINLLSSMNIVVILQHT